MLTYPLDATDIMRLPSIPGSLEVLIPPKCGFEKHITYRTRRHCSSPKFMRECHSVGVHKSLISSAVEPCVALVDCCERAQHTALTISTVMATPAGYGVLWPFSRSVTPAPCSQSKLKKGCVQCGGGFPGQN